MTSAELEAGGVAGAEEMLMRLVAAGVVVRGVVDGRITYRAALSASRRVRRFGGALDLV
ncbi:MAG: hypothetical protein ACOYMR_00100 [Ilumatobacteraceae bacterium]